ncbi:MAG: tetratricopeptide repeat protein [Exilispira sp.]
MRINKIFLFLLILIFFIINVSCSAKNPTIKNDIKKKIDYLITQGNTYFATNQLEKAISTFIEAYNLSITIDDLDRIIKTSLKLAEVFIFKNEPDKALTYLIQAKKISEKEKLKIYYSQIFFFYARYYELNKNYKQSIENYEKAISFASNDLDKSIALNGIGLFYLKMKEYDESLKYLNEAYKINTKLKNYIQLANNSYNIAICYFNKNDFSKSLQYALEALKYDKISENQFNILEDCKLIAKIYEKINDIENAIYYITKAINIAQVIAQDQVKYLLSELERLQKLK